MEERAEVYYCNGCGGIMQFDITKQAFCCPNCGNAIEMTHGDEQVEEHDFSAYLNHPVDDEWARKMEIQRCQSCGAEIIVPENATTAHCAYCGSAQVLKARQGEGIRPEAIVLFRVDRHQVGEHFRKWIKGKWFAPGALKQLYQQDKLQSVYLPYWTYDADTIAHYIGQGGKVYYVTVGSGDNKHEEQRVRWYPVSGTVSHFFDDVLISAKAEPDALEQRAAQFNTKDCEPFDMAYLSGYQAEKYTLGVEEGYKKAQSVMRDGLCDMARRQILQSYDEAQVDSIQPHFFNVKFKHMLLPMWMSAYYYQGKLYRFLVNGQTGRVVGKYPKSKVRVALAVLLGIAIIALLWWWFSQS